MRLVIVALVLVLVVGAGQAQYPKMVFVEDCTATWCNPCYNAYAGIEVMKATYDTNEFRSIRYYATSGNYGNGDTTMRLAYYGVNAYPTVMFNGTIRVVGADGTTATGATYDPIVAAGIAEPSSFKITINSVDLVDPGSIDFDVEVIETVPDIGNVKIRVALLENNLTADHTDATRDMLPDVNLTVSMQGQVQNVVHNFPIDPTWVNEKWMAVFIQDDDDQAIWQAATTAPQPAYSPRFYARGDRVVIVTTSLTEYEFDEFAVFNLGQNPDVIRVALEEGAMPGDWACVFTDGVNDYTTYVDVALAPGESQSFNLRVDAASPGYAMPRIVITSQNLLGFERSINYDIITDDVDVLFVDDDGADTYEDYHKAALEAYGATYGIWDRNLGAVSAAALSPFGTVFWQTGFAFPTLVDADRAALGSFLDGGGNLFITGQDIGWDSWDQGGEAIAWYRNYLHANYLSDDVNNNFVTGVEGDPVADGLSLTLFGGDGANNNFYPSSIAPYDEWASSIFTYDGTAYTGAVKAATPVHKVVYLAFPYEAINNAADRNLLTARVLDWFSGASSVPGSASLDVSSVRAFPNPAPGGATLSYVIPASGSARLGIYALDGSLVRTLVNGRLDAGRHAIRWNGLDDSGRRVASGVYFYRLETGRDEPSGRLILTK